MSNAVFSQLLTDIADLLELKAENVFRIRAFRRASEVIKALPHDIVSLDRASQLLIPGIGKGISDMIEEFKKEGHINELEKLKKEFPAGLLELMNLEGLGPKRAAHLFHDLKIDSLQKLKAAAESGKLLQVPGFGEKLQETLLKSIAYQSQTGHRLLLPNARRFADEIKTYLSKSPSIKQVELAGSARRWKETVGDLDFLCASTQPEKAIAHFIQAPTVERVLAQGATKASVMLKTGLQCDFRVVEAASFGAALVYFTGSKEHNVRLRELAQKKGFTLNEYGLFKLTDTEKKHPVAGRTEEDVYEHLGLPWIPPELREDRGEIEAGLENRLPHLVTMNDVKGDVHNHTTLSDGIATMEEMVAAAAEKKWEWYFCGDHSPSLKIAGGLPPEILAKKKQDIQRFMEHQKRINVFLGSEVDILSDGKLDYSDEVLNTIDCVVASVHSQFKQPVDLMTARICRAMENPHVDIIGHVSGRLLNKRHGYDVNYDALLEKAKETQTALEINGQPDRLDLSDVFVKRAVERGVPLVLSSDAHQTSDLDNVEWALHVARRGWAEPQHILNCLKTEEILRWLNR